MQHAFTVDMEDWFQGIPVSDSLRKGAERRLEVGVDVLLELMARHEIKGTFFLLGPVAEDHPHLVKRLADEGHELGCHGWSHDLLYQMTPERFREETRRAVRVIEDLTSRGVSAYRAAYFSITRQSFWVLDELVALGFRYDSSIFPTRNWRYGIPDFDPRPQRIETQEGPIYELPISIRRVLGRNWPVSGGAYFRIYPYHLTRANFLAAEREKRPVVFYLHPWELDPDHPRVDFHWKPRFTHYVNLSSTRPKLSRLLKDFDFAPLGEVLDHELSETRSTLL